MIQVKRALLSCSDKTELDGFAKALAALGVPIEALAIIADMSNGKIVLAD